MINFLAGLAKGLFYIVAIILLFYMLLFITKPLVSSFIEGWREAEQLQLKSNSVGDSFYD